jgi:multicomponent Na+:H+ antiporter subunit E
MRRWLAMGVSLAVVWLFVRGVELAPRPLAGEFLIGLGIGLPVAFVFRRFYRADIDLTARLRGGPYAVVYVLLFLKELLTANIEVAYRVLHPSLPIEPGVLEFPLRVETDLGITTIANSITLTPGTLTMEYDDENHSLYVHTLDSRDRTAVVEPIRRWEDYALLIFDEKRSPDDPIPGPDTDRSGDTAGQSDPADVPGGQGGDADGE